MERIKKKIKEQLKQLDLSLIKTTEYEIEFFLWNHNEIDDLNKNYEVEIYHSGFYAIGSNGGGEMLTIELETGILYALPFISTDNSDKIKVADSISDIKQI